MRRQAFTLQAVPTKLRGPRRTALRAGLRLAAERSSPEEELRGWKFFMLAPRMLLHREPGTARISPEELQSRCDLFSKGLWQQLLQQAARTGGGPQAMHAANQAEEAARAARASARVHIGELSAAGRALVSEPLAPGNEDTLQQLCDPARRPNARTRPSALMSSTTSQLMQLRSPSRRSLQHCAPLAGVLQLALPV